MSDNTIVPFDKAYVLRTTFNHMIKSIDISIEKTLNRMKDFDSNPEKASEILLTLSDLHTVRKVLKDYQRANPNQFKGN